MPTKPRPLGNLARSYVHDADAEMVTALRQIAQSECEASALAAEILRERAKGHLIEARRLMQCLLALRD
jgi:hypothetical protein